jgi:DNA-binding response OmpR family regulator
MSIDEDCKKILLVVSDTGTGIPREKQELIFTRFAQIQPSTTGIGLSLAKELAELHKGSIRFESTPGMGTRFEVLLSTDPQLFNREDFSITSESKSFHKLPVIETEEEISTPKNISAINSTKILIIEDNQEIRNFLFDYLSKLFHVEEAENGSEGLKKAVELEPDLIISDIMMPEMDGIEVTQKLRSEFQTSHIPIILLTALASDDYQLKGTEAGADAYITKPFRVRYLMTKIMKLLEQRETLRQRFSTETNQVTVTLCKNEKDKEFMDKAFEIAKENIARAFFIRTMRIYSLGLLPVIPLIFLKNIVRP